jgi:hypothetical protein
MHRKDDGIEWWAIHEVYYDEGGMADAVTRDAVGLEGDTVEEVTESYRMMAGAFKKPILEYDSIGLKP